MANIATDDKRDGASSSALITTISNPQHTMDDREGTTTSDPVYRVYKRRFFGLAQLVLLNIVVSWDWLTFSALSKTSAEFFDVSETAINWLSTAFLFAFVAVSPIVLWTLNRGGPKSAIIATAVLILVGNWIRYAGTYAPPRARYGVVMFGQVLIGFAQPFCLTTPTRYSDQWFTDRGRISATAVASLANPLGGALGELIDPFWATKASEVRGMVLYIAIISTIACLPSFFVPAAPPTPPTRSAANPERPAILPTIKQLSTSPSFYCILLPFAIYVGLFNAFSTLINQYLEPYGFSETEAGIAGALLIVVGLIASAVGSPILDKTRNKPMLATIRILVPIIAIFYIAFYWAPKASSGVEPYIFSSFIGAASFILLPVALEYLVEITYPLSPEIGSVVLWTAGQFLGAIFIIVGDALKESESGWWGPKNNLQRGLVFNAVIAVLGVPWVWILGVEKLGLGVRNRRLDVDHGGEEELRIRGRRWRWRRT